MADLSNCWEVEALPLVNAAKLCSLMSCGATSFHRGGWKEESMIIAGASWFRGRVLE